MKLINKKGEVITATDKTYKLFYKNRGFKKYEASESPESDLNKEDDLYHYTNNELKELLDLYGVEYTTRDTKADLVKKVMECC